MPFAQADLYAATLSGSASSHTHERPGLATESSSGFRWTIKSTHILLVAFLLFLATGAEAYFKQSRATPMSMLNGNYGASDIDVFVLATKELIGSITDVFTPLMILSCTIMMVGTLCRGAEQVIKATAFKGC